MGCRLTEAYRANIIKQYIKNYDALEEPVKKIISNALSILTQEERCIILLSYRDRVKRNVICNRLGISIRTAARRRNSALHKIEIVLLVQPFYRLQLKGAIND